MPAYVPDVGDVIWLDFDPQTGHEQAGRRPALVLSPAQYNSRSGLLLCCPMTTKIKGYPFEVVESANPPSAILADQIKSFDWRARNATKASKQSKVALTEVRGKIKSLLGL